MGTKHTLFTVCKFCADEGEYRVLGAADEQAAFGYCICPVHGELKVRDRSEATVDGNVIDVTPI